MDIRILNRGAGEPVTHDQIEERIETALDRFESHIARIDVTVEDVNGPKGGADKHCKLVITLRPPEDVIVNETAGDVLSAVAGAADRAAQAVSRVVQRFKRGIGA